MFDCLSEELTKLSLKCRRQILPRHLRHPLYLLANLEFQIPHCPCVPLLLFALVSGMDTHSNGDQVGNNENIFPTLTLDMHCLVAAMVWQSFWDHP